MMSRSGIYIPRGNNGEEQILPHGGCEISVHGVALFIWPPDVRTVDFLHLFDRKPPATLIRDSPSKRPFPTARTIRPDQLSAPKQFNSEFA